MLCAGQSQDCPDPCFAHEQFQDCAANPWFLPQTMDPGFAQNNPGIEGNGGVKGRKQGIGDMVDKHNIPIISNINLCCSKVLNRQRNCTVLPHTSPTYSARNSIEVSFNG